MSIIFVLLEPQNLFAYEVFHLWFLVLDGSTTVQGASQHSRACGEGGVGAIDQTRCTSHDSIQNGELKAKSKIHRHDERASGSGPILWRVCTGSLNHAIDVALGPENLGTVSSL